MVETSDLSLLFDQSAFDPLAYEKSADAAYASFQAYEKFEQLVREQRAKAEAGDGDAFKVALGLLILGKYSEALEWFGRGGPAKARHYYMGETYAALGRFDKAIDEYQKASGAGWDALQADLRAAATHLRAGDAGAAEKILTRHKHAGQDRAEWHYVRGLLHENQEQRVEAAEEYEKALTLDPDHAAATFRCAWLYDICGDDEAAIELYKRLAYQPRAHVNALINLAVVYEDLGRFDDAADCLRRVLRAFPRHARARLFLKDVESCREMVIHEGAAEKVDPRKKLLETPISEFELSARARNCLKKMKINTLGELIKLSDAELLAFKNFGETSLNEIRALLQKKGLHLGQIPEEIDVVTLQEAVAAAPPPPPRPAIPPGREGVLVKPVTELELSVRARRCLQRLNVGSIGDLIQLSEGELLQTRNFGVTSLNEIKAKLTEMGLSLATRPGE